MGRGNNGAKYQAFSEEFAALGVRFELGDALRGATLVVRNTEKRRIALQGLLREILAEGSLHAVEAASVVGKLQFGRALLLGASISMSKTSSVQPNLALSDDLVISRSLMLLLAQLGLLIFQLSPAIT